MARKLVKEKVGKTNQNQLVTAEVHRLVDNPECLELPRSCEYQLGNLLLPPLEQNLAVHAGSTWLPQRHSAVITARQQQRVLGWCTLWHVPVQREPRLL